ncbi:MAG: hypothetical protein ACI4I4_07020, partial [Acutalibacteraceae bacterium]
GRPPLPCRWFVPRWIRTPGDFPDYSYSDWENMSTFERRKALEAPVIKYGGTPHFTDDFLSDTKTSHNIYEGFVNGYSLAGGIIPNIASSISLESLGQADLRLGFYNSDVPSDGTAADTLNDEFLDYYQNEPFTGNSSSPQFEFSNGYYLVFEYVTNGSGGYTHKRDGVSHTKYGYKPRFLLYDNTGTMIQVYNPPSYSTSYICNKRDDIPFFDITFTENGKYYYYYYGDFWDCPPTASKSSLFDIPFYSQYGTPTQKTDDIFAVGVNENGDKIDIQLNSDGVTYEGDTYSIDNSDHSVTINGDKYYITINPSDVDPDYYQKFLDDTLQKYFDNYKPPEITFDSTDIISSLNSIFNSLESFRTDFYNKIRSISTNLVDGFNTLISQLSKISKKLDNILTQLKDINKTLDEITTEQEEQNNLAWLELISSFKSKVGWASLDQSISNISTAFFGKREYSFTPSGAVAVDIVTSEGSVSSSMPSLYFEYDGVKYDIFTCLGSLGSGIDTIKSFISVFLWIGFIISVYRSLPSILGGVSSFEDHSNNVIVDKSTGEIKRGA